MLRHKKEKAYIALKRQYLAKRDSMSEFAEHVAEKKQSLASIRESQGMIEPSDDDVISEDGLRALKAIEDRTEAHLKIAQAPSIDLDNFERFVHTPKDGMMEAEDETFFLNHLKKNQYIQTRMGVVDTIFDAHIE
jgi:hypothetical protein